MFVVLSMTMSPEDRLCTAGLTTQSTAKHKAEHELGNMLLALAAL